MKELNDTDLGRWLAERSISLILPRLLQFSAGSSPVHTVELPDTALGRAALLRHLIGPDTGIDISGAVLWLTSWAILEEYFFPRVYELARVGVGLPPDVVELAISTDGSPAADVFAMFGLFVVAGWDAFLVPPSGDFFLFTSNDGFLDVVAADDRIRDELLLSVAHWKPSPMLRDRYARQQQEE